MTFRPTHDVGPRTQCIAVVSITRRESPVFILSTEASHAHRVWGDIQLLTKATRGVSLERNTAITVPVSGLFAATESQRLINRINQNGFRSVRMRVSFFCSQTNNQSGSI